MIERHTRSVECTIAWILLPLPRNKLVQRCCQHLWAQTIQQLSLSTGRVHAYSLSLIPSLVVSQTLLWPRRQLQLECEAKQAVDVFQEIENLPDFMFNLMEQVIANQSRRRVGQPVYSLVPLYRIRERRLAGSGALV